MDTTEAAEAVPEAGAGVVSIPFKAIRVACLCEGCSAHFIAWGTDKPVELSAAPLFQRIKRRRVDQAQDMTQAEWALAGDSGEYDQLTDQIRTLEDILQADEDVFVRISQDVERQAERLRALKAPNALDITAKIRTEKLREPQGGHVLEYTGRGRRKDMLWPPEDVEVAKRGLQLYQRNFQAIADFVNEYSAIPKTVMQVRNWFNNYRKKLNLDYYVDNMGEPVQLPAMEHKPAGAAAALDTSLDVSHAASASASAHPTPVRHPNGKSGKTGKRGGQGNRYFWNSEEIELFKEGLVMYGKNFDAIGDFLVKRLGVDPASAKSTDQVRKWFYNHRETDKLDDYLAKHSALYGHAR